MTCPACGFESEAAAKFCAECGASLHGTPGADAWELVMGSASASRASRRPGLSDEAVALIVLAASLTLAALAQFILREEDPATAVPWYGAAILCFSLALGAAAVSFLPEGHADPLVLWRRVPIPRPNLALTAGLAVEAVLLVRLLDGSRAGTDLAWWILALTLAGAGVLGGRRGWPAVDRSALRPGRVRPLLPGVVFVSGLLLAFVGVASRDLDHWRFSVIGDEYLFYEWARAMIAGGITGPFSHNGVYSTHPVLTTVYQASVMAVLGEDAVGWRMASVLAIAAAIPAIYLLAGTLFGRPAAVAASITFAASHYLMAYAHTGYDNAYAIAPTAWALCLFVEGLRRGHAWLLYASGLAAGLGFYTFFSGRTAIVILALFVLTSGVLRRRVLTLWPLALGFVLTVAPLFAASGYDAIGVMFDEVSGGYNEDVSGSPADRIGDNIATNLLAFNTNSHAQHFVSGSLADAFTAVAAVAGLGIALGMVSRNGPRLIVLWFVVGFVATGLLSPYPYTVISRLSFLVAPLALLAGLAAQTVFDSLSALRMRTAGYAALAVFAVSVVALNANRFWWESPRTLHLSNEAVAIGASREPICADRYSTIVGPAVGAALVPALESYGDPFVFAVDQSLFATRPYEEVLFPGCVIFTDPSSPEARGALDWLGGAFPRGQAFEFTDAAKKGRVLVFVMA